MRQKRPGRQVRRLEKMMDALRGLAKDTKAGLNAAHASQNPKDIERWVDLETRRHALDEDIRALRSMLVHDAAMGNPTIFPSEDIVPIARKEPWQCYRRWGKCADGQPHKCMNEKNHYGEECSCAWCHERYAQDRRQP